MTGRRTRRLRKRVVEETTPTMDGRFEKLFQLWKKYGSNYLLPAIIVIFALFYFLNILNERSLGLSIGLVYLLGILGVFAFWIFFKNFPKYVQYSLIGFSIIYFLGLVYPFYEVIFPGEPLFDKTISKGGEDITIDGITSGGYYTLFISATDKMSKAGMYRNVRGEYNIKVGEKALKGNFSDEWVSARVGRRGSRQVERKHTGERHTLYISKDKNKISINNIDDSLGGEVRIKIYKSALPLPVLIIFSLLILSCGIFLDVKFSEETKKLRLFPLITIAVIFTHFSIISYEPGKELQTPIWSIIISGIVGFLGGWIISLLAKKIKLRFR